MSDPDRFGPYQLLDRLGSGAMGVVWSATGPEGTVALKLIPEHLLADAAIKARLAREATAAGKIVHPGVVRSHGFREYGGKAGLVMELLQGETLADRLAREKALPPAEVERIAATVAETLAFVHRRRIVHRDLKPQNIFLTADGNVKLIDLGVAKVIDEASLTMTGSHFGTPAYMAPESFRDAKQVTAAADLWSLGVILYELATGQLPFPGTSAASIVAKVADPRVSPPSPTLVRPELPEKLVRVIGQCLERDPARRPDAAGIFLELTGRVPETKGKRNRLPLYLGLGCGALVLGVGALVGVAIYIATGPGLMDSPMFGEPIGPPHSLVRPDEQALTLTIEPFRQAGGHLLGSASRRLTDGVLTTTIAGINYRMRMLREADLALLEIDRGADGTVERRSAVAVRTTNGRESIRWPGLQLGEAGMTYDISYSAGRGNGSLIFWRTFIWTATLNDPALQSVQIIDEDADGEITDRDYVIVTPRGKTPDGRDYRPLSQPWFGERRQLDFRVANGTVIVSSTPSPVVLEFDHFGIRSASSDSFSIDVVNRSPDPWPGGTIIVAIGATGMDTLTVTATDTGGSPQIAPLPPGRKVRVYVPLGEVRRAHFAANADHPSVMVYPRVEGIATYGSGHVPISK